MKVLLFGATGMVGQGVLRECTDDPRVENITAIGRTSTRRTHAKLSEIVLSDLFDISTVSNRLSGFDACFFCLGVSSLGLSELEYTRLTYDLTLEIAGLLARNNPSMTFIYVSGAGTDETGQSRFMWARVKGRTEMAIRALPFKTTYMFRPGFIQPLHGVRSKTGWVQAIYALTAPISPVLRKVFPNALTTTEQIGRAMIAVVASGYLRPVLETSDINAVR